MPTTTQPQFDLAELAERYEILGELAGGDAAMTFIGRRRADGADVQISVFAAPQGDEGNALSHLAADVNLLAGATHPNLVPILEGAWTGQDGFVIVTRRMTAATLDERLLKRDEAFSLPRIAAILSQINGAIAWARERKVVHRCVSARSIVIEPGTDRALVAFVPRALPLTEMPGPEEDARTIAQLARAMLTRSAGAAAHERAEQPLGELRPGLPDAVVAQTEQLLSPSREAPAPDVIGYIGAIAMAESLKAGEEHLERTRSLIEEQKRAHQAQLEKERREHDAQLADERARHQKAVNDQAKKFQKEREEFERQLRKDNDALTKERTALAQEREAHRRDCERLRREREEHEREITRVREQLEWEAAALATQQELYARTDEYKTPVLEERPAIVPEHPRPSRPSRLARAWNARGALRSRPVVTAAAVAVLIILIALVVGTFDRSRQSIAGVASESARRRVVDSVAGGVEPSVPNGVPSASSPRDGASDSLGVPADLIAGVAASRAAPSSLPAAVPSVPASASGVPADLLSSVAARADSAPQIPWWRRILRRDRDTVTRRVAPPVTDTAPKLDTILATPPVMRWDTLIRRDTLRRDTLRRDTSVIRDTTRRDTLVVRDTLELRAP